MTNIGPLDPDMTKQEMRLHMGELSATEIRVARAAIRWANTRINIPESIAHYVAVDSNRRIGSHEATSVKELVESIVAAYDFFDVRNGDWPHIKSLTFIDDTGDEHVLDTGKLQVLVDKALNEAQLNSLND